jgi:small subunit ribosomal protein S20
MPITNSAKKAAKRSLVLQARNKEFKLRMKMEMKKFIKRIQKSEDVAIQDLSNIYKVIDKCVKVGVIKKKNASRKKSRMAKMFGSKK